MQPAPLPPLLSILNLITVTPSITTFQTINLTVSNRSRTLLLVLLLRLLNPHIGLSLPFSNLSTGLRSTNALNINFFSLTYKVLTTSQPSYLNNLIPVQLPRCTRSSSVVNLSPFLAHQPSPHWKSHRSYASPRLWNQLPDSFRLASHVSTHLLINLSAHLCHHHHSHHPSLLHSGHTDRQTDGVQSGMLPHVESHFT